MKYSLIFAVLVAFLLSSIFPESVESSAYHYLRYGRTVDHKRSRSRQRYQKARQSELYFSIYQPDTKASGFVDNNSDKW